MRQDRNWLAAITPAQPSAQGGVNAEQFEGIGRGDETAHALP